MTEHEISGAESSTREMREAGIGATLRQAREQRKLSEIDVARSLRLEPRIIHLLENERFEQLPAPAFTRGYLRAVGKELKLDTNLLLEMFDAKGEHEAPLLADFESRAPLEITSDSRIVRYTTAALALGMVLMVALWWRSHADSFSMLKYLTESNPAAVLPLPPTPPLSYSFEQVIHPEDPFFRAPDSEPTPEVSSADTASGGVAAPGDADTGKADIVINSSADAWVEIADADGAKLYYNLVRPGNEVRITGRRPYALVIGNAPAVRLRFAGQAVDLTALAHDGVVHATLGGAGQTAQASVSDEH